MKPLHLRSDSDARKTICGLKEPDDLPYMLPQFVERIRYEYEPCEPCFAGAGLPLRCPHDNAAEADQLPEVFYPAEPIPMHTQGSLDI